jgi:hypothetical protein
MHAFSISISPSAGGCFGVAVANDNLIRGDYCTPIVPQELMGIKRIVKLQTK